MVADGLLTRQRYREVPPRVDYELTERSRELMPVLGALARWGYDWTWSAPREGEEVNIGAILRLGPGLLSPSEDGIVELVVAGDGRQPDRCYVLTSSKGEVTISEHPAEQPDARVVGRVRAWVAALGPEGSTAELDFTGSQRLAEVMLDGFIGAGRRATAIA